MDPMEQPRTEDLDGESLKYSTMVLLVDDQALVAQAVRRLLGNLPDIDLHYCPDPAVAIERANEIMPTVILQDLVMPTVDGLELVRRFRSNAQTADTPIIVLSTEEQPEIKGQAFAAGANDYLVKLPKQVELIARIRYHSKSYVSQLQRDKAFQALRESQRQLLISNTALLTLNQKLEEATRVKAQFLANMSHEIRTPMNGVIGMTRLLDSTELTIEQKNCVDTIRTCGNGLLAIINDILDFSKIEAGKLELIQEPVPLATCIEEALQTFAEPAAEKDLNLAYFLDEKLPETVLGDSTRIRQILLNLLSNAIKFTPSGEVVIRVEAEDGSSLLHFTVTDTGIGIPKEKQAGLFESFNQVDNSRTREYGGTGLGLAISRRLAEWMGGRMWLESEHSGSTFHFTIWAPPVLGAPGVAATAPGLAGKRILLIEANASMCAMASGWMKDCGIEVVTASSALAALAKFGGGERINAVLLDEQLPAADLLASSLGSSSGARSIPVVLLTWAKPPAGKQLSVQTRVTARQFKPLRRSGLLTVLADVLGVAPPRLGSEQKRAPERIVRADRPPLRILVADDNIVNQRVSVALLKHLGYQADVAGDGLEVLRALERRAFDLVFLDLQMPRMDGYETAHEIQKRWRAGARPRIIALTAAAMEGDRESCLAAGMDDYVVKPVELRKLDEVLTRWSKEIQPEAHAVRHEGAMADSE